MTLPSRRVFLAGLLLVAFSLRIAGIDFGLPLAEARPDEQTIAYQAMKFGRGDLNPHSFNYPSLYKYVVFGLFGGDYAIGRLLGRFEGQDDFLRAFFAADSEFRLLMRGWSAVAGTVGVALLTRGPGGLFAAALLAVNFLHVRDSHFGVTDITMTTLVTASALLTERYARHGGWKRLAAAALVAGLATSTKYNAALLALPLALSAWHAPAADGTATSLTHRAKMVGLAAALMVAAFLVGTPYALLDAGSFLRDFQYELSHLERGQYADVGVGWVAHATGSLPDAMGVVGLLVGVFGMATRFRRRGARALVLYGFPVVYFLLIGRGNTAFYRYMLPVVPFLCMGAGSILLHLSKRTTRAGSALNLAVCAVAPLYASLHADRLFLAGDTREAMGEWIEAHVPNDAVIVHAGAYTGAPMLQRNVANNARESTAKAGRSDSAGFRKAEDMKWYRADRPMYDVVFVEKEGIDFASQWTVAEVIERAPTWIEVEDYPLTHYSSVPAELTAFINENYDLVRQEFCGAGTLTAGRFDQQDAFYMPVAGFSAYTRMGPTLRLYRHRSAAGAAGVEAPAPAHSD